MALKATIYILEMQLLTYLGIMPASETMFLKIQHISFKTIVKTELRLLLLIKEQFAFCIFTIMVVFFWEMIYKFC